LLFHTPTIVNVLVVGNGGREHALAWAMLRSPEVSQVFCTPGNGGTASLERCTNLAIDVTDFESIADTAMIHHIRLVIIGPEQPLALGLTDFLQAKGVQVFGPIKAGAQIEASKAWAKALMLEAGVPTAKAAVFEDAASAQDYVRDHGAPIVVKADGLAAGKGVTVAQTVEEAMVAITAAFSGIFGAAGQRVVIEDCLVGAEASVLAITDGKTIKPLLPAQDHKRIGEGDTGPNTGGMGAYAPAPLVTPEIMAKIEAQVLEPTMAALRNRGIDYRGILYAGLMIGPGGEVQVIEFNCRFGDPETQVVLPLLETPLLDLVQAVISQTLDQQPIVWKSGVAACVVASAPGYPGSYPKGTTIAGIAEAEAQGALVFQAGTVQSGSEVKTDGGRVLAAVQMGESFDEAFAKTYEALGTIGFEGIYYRRDIGYQVRTP
jgi:phosphoribosylamine---glycine ligase